MGRLLDGKLETFLFLAIHAVCGILVPGSGTEPSAGSEIVES